MSCAGRSLPERTVRIGKGLVLFIARSRMGVLELQPPPFPRRDVQLLGDAERSEEIFREGGIVTVLSQLLDKGCCGATWRSPSPTVFCASSRRNREPLPAEEPLVIYRLQGRSAVCLATERRESSRVTACGWLKRAAPSGMVAPARARSTREGTAARTPATRCRCRAHHCGRCRPRCDEGDQR